MARQVAGNEAWRRLLADGVACGRCGGVNAVPDDGSVQLACSFCGAAVLLSDHVDAGAVARHRLKHGVFAMRDEALAYASRLEAAGLPVTRHVLAKAAQWPDTLRQDCEHAAPCAAGAQAQFRRFFEATRLPLPE